MAGPTIIAWGSDEQKKRYLPTLLSGEEIWCQGFSEPGSGSDLAGARTRAVLDGDEWVVNGQKVWSSYAHIADWCILVVRTDPEAEKHRGLSYLLVDMHAPGRRGPAAAADHRRPRVQRDLLHRRPRPARVDARQAGRRLVGRDDDAAARARHPRLRAHGRASSSCSAGSSPPHAPRGPTASGPADDPLVRDQIAQLWIDLQALRFTNYRSLTALEKTGVPGPEGSIAKLHWSETNQRLTKLAQELVGPAGQLDGDEAVWDGFWTYQQLRSRGNTIEAGTSEILRNIIAERVVGLPALPLAGSEPPMDFAFSDDQDELRAAARRLLTDRLPDARLHELADSADGTDPALWAELVGLGWVGLSAPAGGGSFLDEAVLLEEAGYALLPAPLLATVIAEPALVRGDQDATTATVLAWAEPSGPLAFEEPDRVETTADDGPGGWSLTGTKSDLPDLGGAQQVVVLARTTAGPALFLTTALDGRLTLHTTDGTRRIGELTLDHAPATLLADAADTPALLASMRRRALAGIALESVGLAARMLATATTQASTREQFGRVIGTYQAVSHHVADMYLRTELARSLAYRAAWCIDALEGDPGSLSEGEVDSACAAAKAAATEAAVFAAEGAIQVLGGIGMTWEHVAHRFYKRALADQSWAGLPARHRETVAAALLDA